MIRMRCLFSRCKYVNQYYFMLFWELNMILLFECTSPLLTVISNFKLISNVNQFIEFIADNSSNTLHISLTNYDKSLKDSKQIIAIILIMITANWKMLFSKWGSPTN